MEDIVQKKVNPEFRCLEIKEEIENVENSNLVETETDNAKYFIHPSNHSKPTRISEEILDAIDCVLIETGPFRYTDWSLNTLNNTENYSKLLDDIIKKYKVPIYNVDVGYDQEKAEKEKLTFFPALNALTGMISEKGYFQSLIPKIQIANFYTSYGLRSALVAEKSEEFIARQMQEELGEKPSILIDGGSGHLDIKEYLEKENLRQNIISLHQKTGYSHLNYNQLNQVCKYDFNEDGDNEFEGVNYDKIISDVRGLVVQN